MWAFFVPIYSNGTEPKRIVCLAALPNVYMHTGQYSDIYIPNAGGLSVAMHVCTARLQPTV